ncbi:hypothetical protein N7467_005448 [Penicillium canescens]|nr:hypothetical protein N7467_005448 [Penicillium canescens]
MSGPLEAIGIAASIIQVADFGTKLSVKLFSFYRELNGANESIQNLSSDVAITSAILRELGENLKEDEQAKLYSKEAFNTLKQVLNQCEEVLKQIRAMTTYSDTSKMTRLQQITERFRQVLLEPNLDPLKANLKRLKSTMLLLLNVIMYAGQIRSNNVPTMLQEQRDFIKILLEEKKKENAKLAIASNPVTMNASLNPNVDPWEKNDPKNSEPPDLGEYSLLMHKMLQEINSCKARLEQNRYSRIKSGVLNIHSGEIMRFQWHHGQSIIQRFDPSLFADELSDGSSMPIAGTAGLTSPICDPQTQHVDAAKRPENSEPSAYFDSDDALNRSPPLEVSKVNYGNDKSSPPPFSLGDSDSSLTRSCDPVDLNLLPQPSVKPSVTREGDRVLMGFLAPNYPKIAVKARESPLDQSPGTSSNHNSSPKELSHPPKSSIQFLSIPPAIGNYKCTYPGCTASPFPTQYLLSSHSNVHAQDRPHFCPVEGCPRSRGGKGFKRKNELMRHGLIHNSPGYLCPFCPGQEHKYPRPDNLLRHVRIHHPDKNKNDPILRQVLAQRPLGSTRGEKRRMTPENNPDPPPGKRYCFSSFSPATQSEDLCRNVGSPVSLDTYRAPSSDDSNTQNLPDIHRALSALSDFGPPPVYKSISPWKTKLDAFPNQTTVEDNPFKCPSIQKALDGTETLEMLVLEWTNLTREEILLES